MAVKTFWVDSSDGETPAYTATDLNRFFSYFFKGHSSFGTPKKSGIISFLEVDTLSNSRVAIGPGIGLMHASGGGRFLLIDDTIVVSAPAPHATYDAIHAIVLAPTADGNGEVKIVKGTASASPRPPTVEEGIILADVRVPKSGAISLNLARRETIVLNSDSLPGETNLPLSAGYTGHVQRRDWKGGTTVKVIGLTVGSGATTTICSLPHCYNGCGFLADYKGNFWPVMVSSQKLVFVSGVPPQKTVVSGTLTCDYQPK